VVEHLPSSREALSSNSYQKKKKRKKRKWIIKDNATQSQSHNQQIAKASSAKAERDLPTIIFSNLKEK
jgi:hypothetical protein